MTTFYMSPTGSDAAAGTSAATAFKTVSKAQTAMAATGGSDTMLIESGTYAAGATLTSGNTGDTIKADSGATVVFDGANAATTFFTLSGANNVTITGLKFQNTATGLDNDTVLPAILVGSGTGEMIQGNTFQSLGSAVIFNAGSGTIDRNTMADMGSVAIRLRGTATGVTVSNNTITHSSYDLPEGGAIEIVGTGGNTITHNAIDDSAYNGIWDESSGNNVITWNKVTNSVLVSADGGGIYAFFPSAGDTIANNWVVNSLSNPNLNWGIYLDDNVDNTLVTGNYAQGTAAGLMNHGGDSVTVQNNIFIGQNFGLQVQGTGDPAPLGVSDNTVIDHNVIDGQIAVAAYEWGTNNTTNHNVLIGTSSSQLGFDPQTVAQWQATGQDAGSLLEPSMANVVNANGSLVPGSKAVQLGIVATDFSQVGPVVVGGSTSVTTQITDHVGNTFAITATAQILINGVPDTGTSLVVLLLLWYEKVYQQNSNLSWYVYGGLPGAWNFTGNGAAGDPRLLAAGFLDRTVTGLAANTQYDFEVLAINAVGTGPASSPIVSATTTT